MTEQQHSPARPARPVLRDAAVDHAIDRAVQRMMHIDPGPGLGRRVRSRIASPAVKRSLYSAPYLAAAGALAMLVLGVGLLRPEVARDTASTTTAGGNAPSAPLRAHVPTPAEERKEAPESLSSDPAMRSMRSVPPDAAASQASRKAAPVPPPALQRAEGVSQHAVAPPGDAEVRVEAIPMPEIVNLFGGPETAATGNAVRGANFAGVAESIVIAPGMPMPRALEIVNLALPPLTIEPLRISPIPASGKEP